MSDRFSIQSYGIVDKFNNENEILSWGELCDILNRLDYLADENLDEYEYITKLELENQMLKVKIVGIVGLGVKIGEYVDDIKLLGELNEIDHSMINKTKKYEEKVRDVLQKKYDALKKDYDFAVENGLPSLILYDEIEDLENLAKELDVVLE